MFHRFSLLSVGGASISPELVRATKSAFDCEFQCSYAMTEASPEICLHGKNETIEDICVTSGHPLPHTEVSVRSTTDGSIVPLDTVGEIWVRGHSLMIGYHGNPDLTATTIDAEGWLHTGDLGSMRSDGDLTVIGRALDLIIRGGENISPAEIEDVVMECEAVMNTAVLGLPSYLLGESIACFVVTEPGKSVSKEELKQHCTKRLSRSKVPASWYILDEFPLTGSGKIQKKALLEGVQAGIYRRLKTVAQ